MKFSKKIKSGFTLIEIMIVVIIVALMLVLAAGVYLKYIARGGDARRKSDLERIKIAIEEYEKDNNCYPLPTNMNQCGSDLNPVKPYLTNVPCDPVTGDAYYYETDGLQCPKWYHLYANLQNSEDPDRIPWIGPGGAFDYFESSDNAPLPIVNLPPGCQKYGCVNYQCIAVEIDENCNAINCDKAFDNPDCNVPGNCKDPSNDCNAK